MANASFFQQVTPTTYSVLALLAVVVIALVKVWPLILAKLIEARRDKVDEKAGDWSRLRGEIERLDGRCDHLQQEVDECHRREGEWMSRAIRAESALLGKGEVRQEAQRIVSAERQADAAKKDGGS